MMLSKILVTGFDPFGGESVNPAYEAVKLLPDTIAGARIVKLEVPTVFTRSAEVLEQAIAAERPDAVICIGQAGGRSCVTVEQVAINLAEARIPDNDGEQPLGQPLRADGPAAYFATVPVKEMAAAMETAGSPATVSNSAGAFVCNDTLYSLLHHYDGTAVRVGFIHVPYLPEQGSPSLPLKDTVKALTEAILAMGL